MAIRILVVDDYEPWRRWVCSALQKESRLQVVGEAANGADAISKALELEPDLIVLDIGLPKLSGIEAARQIRQQSPRQKILFLTENRAPDIAEEAMKMGAAGYVIKSDAGNDFLQAVIAVLESKQFVSRRFARHAFAENSHTFPLRERGHVVQFYSDDSQLLDSLCGLFKDTLNAGESLVAAITRSHRRGLEKRLIARGIDVVEVTKSGRLVMLDAHDMLCKLMDKIEPNRERFLMLLETTLRRAEAAAVVKNRRVVVFGEMVALLWAQKRYDAAIRLEELWNELAVSHAFYLCCGYAASGFQAEVKPGAYARICAQHSNVVSAF